VKNPPSDKFVQQILKAWWKEAIEHGTTVKIDPTRKQFLRASGLPFCPVKEGYKRLVDGVETERHVSFKSDYFFDIGHAIHNLCQNFLGRLQVKVGTKTPVKVLGHWFCPTCKAVRKFTTYKACKCGGDPRYEEIAIHWRTTVGHIDKVIRIGDMLIILDYKSCGTYALQKHRRAAPGESSLPYHHNRAQIERYVGLFERVFKDEFAEGGKFEGCTVVGSILAYISRETPDQKEFIFLPSTEGQKLGWYKKAKKDDRLFVIMDEVVKNRDYALMKELVEEKPCGSLEEYQKNMHSPYSECPLKGICFDRKKLLGRLKIAVTDPDSLKEKVEEYDDSDDD
jgi:hypothetical protein